MPNNSNKDKIQFFNRWKAVAIFLFLLIFQPATATFLAFRPSDAWLFLSLIIQYKKKEENQFLSKTFHYQIILYYGFYMGILAIIATVLQAGYMQIGLNPSFFFQFYKFLRYYLIFRLIRNIEWGPGLKDTSKLLFSFFMFGLLAVIMVFLEANYVQPFVILFKDLYTEYGSSGVETYYVGATIERAAGTTGNSNASATIIAATLVFPFFGILRNKNPLFKVIFIGFIFGAIYSMFVYFGSRTAIFACFTIPVIAFVARSKSLMAVINALIIFIALYYAGTYFFEKYHVLENTQDRVLEAFTQGAVSAENARTNEWRTRVEMWNDRLNTLYSKGNPLSIIIGLGYTKVYKDYADNGLVSSLTNNGIIGLVFKILLLYSFFYLGYCLLIKYRKFDKSPNSSIIFCICLIMIFYELSADLLEQHRLGQVFYIFFCILFWMKQAANHPAAKSTSPKTQWL